MDDLLLLILISADSCSETLVAQAAGCHESAICCGNPLKAVSRSTSEASVGAGCAAAGGGMLSAASGSLQERDEEQEDEGEEELRDGGVPFYVNRGGLPVDEETWERMWRQVARIHPNGEALGRDIRRATDLPKVKRTGVNGAFHMYSRSIFWPICCVNVFNHINTTHPHWNMDRVQLNLPLRDEVIHLHNISIGHY